MRHFAATLQRRFARLTALACCALLASFSLFANPAFARETDNAKRCAGLIEKAAKAIKAGQEESATTSVEKAQQACATSGASPSNHQLAVLHLDLGKLLYEKHAEDALAHFRTALVLDPENPRASLNTGGALIKLRHYAEAVPILESAIARGTGDTDVRFKLEYNAGFAFINLCLKNRHCDAVRGEQHLARAAELNPDFADTYFQQAAMTNDGLHDSRRAMALFKKACDRGHDEGCRQYEHFKAGLGE
ncbi:MAG: tetratricopeptide repeat protein [Tahibacter sp.]